MKQNILLLASLAIAILAAVLTYSYLRAKDREIAKTIAAIRRESDPIDVVGTERDLPTGSTLRVEDLGLIAVPRNAVRGHHISQEDFYRILGRRTLHPLSSRDPVLWSDIEGGRPGATGLAHDIKPRMRAISINVSGAAAVSGMVRPTDRVDVIGTFTLPSPGDPDSMELITMTILQDVTVLACGRETARSATGFNERPGMGGGYNMVTIEVTPREAEVLVFAEQVKGRLTLSLRNPADVHYERQLPRVNVEQIEAELQRLNEHRQIQLLRKRVEG